MPIEPTKFIVRNLAYPQVATYPIDCKTITEGVLPHDFHDAGALVHAISDRMPKSGGWQGFAPLGVIREYYPDKLMPYTVLDACYRAPVARAMRKAKELQKAGRLPADVEYAEMPTLELEEITLFYDHANHRMPLSRISLHTKQLRNPYLNRMHHPPVSAFAKIAINPPADSESACEAKLRRDAIFQAYSTAMNPTGQKKEREEQAVIFYSLLCHDLPVTRGSATLARIALEYMAQKIGFEVPFTKPNCDLNMEALIRTPGDFLDAWHKKEFFDYKVTPGEIIKWQKYAIEKRDKLPTGGRYH